MAGLHASTPPLTVLQFFVSFNLFVDIVSSGDTEKSNRKWEIRDNLIIWAPLKHCSEQLEHKAKGDPLTCRD